MRRVANDRAAAASGAKGFTSWSARTADHIGQPVTPLLAGGSIINFSTTVNRNPPPGTSLYIASKSAIEAMTQVFAKELGPRKIRVNAISPGEVETEGTRSAGIVGSDFEKQMLQQTPLGRIGQPDDIAPVAVFLASDDARWVTGEILAASGGL